MKWYRFLFILVCLQTEVSSFSQREQVDSLSAVLNTNLVDSIRVDVLNEIAYRYQDISSDSALLFAESAYLLSDSIGYKRGIAVSYARKGSIYFTTANDDEALDFYLTALELSQEIKDSVNLSAVYHGLGIIYDIMDEEEKGMEMLQKALEIAENKSLDVRKVRVLLSMSILSENMDNPDAALLYVRNGLNLSREINYPEGIIITSNFIARLFRNQNNLEQALNHLNTALTIAREQGNLARSNHALVGIGEIYTLRGEYNKARIVLNEAIQLVSKTDLLSYKQDAYEKLYHLDSLIGDYESALANYIKNVELLDSIGNVETTNRLNELLTKYETERKEKEIAIQQQQIAVLEKDQHIKTLWRNILIVVIIIIFLAALTTIRFIRIRNENDKKFLHQKIEFQNKELASFTVNFIQKRNLLDELDTNLKKVEQQVEKESKQYIRQVRKKVNQNESIDRDWEEFKLYFENVHKDFFALLKKQHPDVSGADLKLCSLIKLNMNIKEMSSVLGISPESVKTARYRLRKKLTLKTEDNLHDYITGLEKSI